MKQHKAIWFKGIITASLLAMFSTGASAISVLWYSGGVAATPDYKTTINGLIADAAAGPHSTAWSITYWDAGPMPAGSYDVLVSASQTGGWDSYPDYTALTSSGLTEASFGDRIMVSGQDADWHYIHNPGHQSTFDSSQGFLVDAIDWAGTGSGMGAVFFDASPAFGMLSGLGTETGNHGDSVIIPPATAGFPINDGLTTGGLSNWGSSHHVVWQGWDTSKWLAINLSDDCAGGTASQSDCAVTLVSKSTAGGPIGAPEPGSLALLGLGLLGLGFGRRRKS